MGPRVFEVQSSLPHDAWFPGINVDAASPHELLLRADLRIRTGVGSVALDGLVVPLDEFLGIDGLTDGRKENPLLPGEVAEHVRDLLLPVSPESPEKLLLVSHLAGYALIAAGIRQGFGSPHDIVRHPLPNLNREGNIHFARTIGVGEDLAPFSVSDWEHVGVGQEGLSVLNYHPSQLSVAINQMGSAMVPLPQRNDDPVTIKYADIQLGHTLNGIRVVQTSPKKIVYPESALGLAEKQLIVTHMDVAFTLAQLAARHSSQKFKDEAYQLLTRMVFPWGVDRNDRGQQVETFKRFAFMGPSMLQQLARNGQTAPTMQNDHRYPAT